jgi:hypothetical protein
LHGVEEKGDSAVAIVQQIRSDGMARNRTATDRVRGLTAAAVRRALEASLSAGSMKPFYAIVDMRNPSRSYFVRHGGQLHSLKAVVTFALKEERPGTSARDFHAADAAQRVRELGFDVVHNVENADEQREREWISRLKRAGQVEFRSKLIDLYGRCALSGCTTLTALEAAHVRPVSGRGADVGNNGILLRADLHKLFDADLLAINPSNGRVALAESCKPDYERVVGGRVFVPPPGGPTLKNFERRWSDFAGQHEAK